MNNNTIQPALLDWNEQGTPVSRAFRDVYFSHQNGLAETRYVFLAGNQIPARLAHHQRTTFTVAETGFGTGLNFMALWQAIRIFRQSQPRAPLKRLHFISCEKFPLSTDDLITAHALWPELSELSAQLRQQWPLPLAGCHRLQLDDQQVILDLWFGDINLLLSDWRHHLQHQVDAWFLDGFSPAKNPEMWTPQLFHTLAQTLRPQGTLATFTSAGSVRRGLQQAGFTLRKIKGFAQKREMLTAEWPSTRSEQQRPCQDRPSQVQRPEDIAIIGGGIASVLTAAALMRRGAQVTLYCQDRQSAEGASGNRQGALYPLLTHDNPLRSHFFATAFLYARRCYDQLAQQGIRFDHQWCGVSQLAYDDQSRRKIDLLLQQGWTNPLLYAVDSNTLSQLCGLPIDLGGITYPLGGWLSPAQLTHHLFTALIQHGMTAHWQSELSGLNPDPAGWQLQFSGGTTHTHSLVILAQGHRITELSQTANLPLVAVRGQVSHAPATPVLQQLRQVLCYQGYLTPINPTDQLLCIGASHLRQHADTTYQAAEQVENHQRLIHCLPNQRWPQHIDISAGLARCGIRSTSRDHLPMVGAVPDYNTLLTQYTSLPQHLAQAALLSATPVYNNLFMLGGLGSRGLCTAPLLAEVLAAQLFGEPLPIDRETLQALNPNRIWIRKLLKGKKLSD